MTTLVVQETTILAPSTDGGMLPAPAKLAFTDRDPWSVHLHIEANGVWVRWTFSRDLLDLGSSSDEPYGDGDVKVWRCPNIDVHILLNNGQATCEIELNADDVDEFLFAAYEAVPLGTEWVDVDEAISALMGDA